MTYLHIQTIKKYLRHEIFCATNINTFVDICVNDDKLILKIYGFSQIINELLDKVVNVFVSPNMKILNTFFDQELVLYKEYLNNYIYEQPYIHCLDMLNSNLVGKYISPLEQYKFVSSIKKTDVLPILNIFHSGNIRCLIEGNLSKDIFVNIKKLLGKLDQSLTTKISDDKNSNMIQQPTNKKIVINNLNKLDMNSAISFVIKFESLNINKDINTNKKICLILMLELIMKEPFFDELRTKEQLGYIVRAKLININNKYHNTYLLNFLIQSPNHTVDHLEKYIFNFLQKYTVHINNMTDENYNSYILTLKNNINKKYDSLADEFEFNCKEIITGIYNFAIREMLSDACDKLCKQDIINFYIENIGDALKNNSYLVFGINGNKQ